MFQVLKKSAVFPAVEAVTQSPVRQEINKTFSKRIVGGVLRFPVSQPSPAPVQSDLSDGPEALFAPGYLPARLFDRYSVKRGGKCGRNQAGSLLNRRKKNGQR